MENLAGYIVVVIVVVLISLLTYYGVRREMDIDESAPFVSTRDKYLTQEMQAYLNENLPNKSGLYEHRYKKAMRDQILYKPSMEYFGAGVVKFLDGNTLGCHYMENTGSGMDFVVTSMYIQIDSNKWELVGIGMDAPLLKNIDTYLSKEEKEAVETPKIVPTDSAQGPYFWLKYFTQPKIAIKELK